MSRILVLSLGLLGVLGVYSYGQGMRGLATSQGPAVLAGAINSDGSILRGSHFLVRHVSSGVYLIRFIDSYFAGTCPVLTVTSVGYGRVPPWLQVFERKRCRTYLVFVYNDNTSLVDRPFNFIAVGTE